MTDRTLLRKANLVNLAHDEINRHIMVGELREGEMVNAYSIILYAP